MSRPPGPTRHDPASPLIPARTPGSLGIRDAGDPNTLTLVGDTPGTLGLNDGAGPIQGGPAVRQQNTGIGPAGSTTAAAVLTDEEIDAAVEQLSPEEVTGGKRPEIAGHKIPTNQSVRLDIEDIPRLPGETARQALQRVRTVIGQKISDIPEVRAAWERARQQVLQNRTLTASNHEELYNLTRSRFWQEVRRSAAKDYFAKAGFRFPRRPTSAPLLGVSKPGMPITETRVSLDHLAEKAIGEHWRRALDPDNLQMEFAMPNTYREIIQVRHPELRH